MRQVGCKRLEPGRLKKVGVLGCRMWEKAIRNRVERLVWQNTKKTQDFCDSNKGGVSYPFQTLCG